ncbi:uncharacterized protein PG986_003234 [Apiospora aurea]|uniref:Uncharacterized protein n=1 Tax=Apiospora aurea TaxID=335848 RepID=A0ABR1QR27_9PEZI
MALYHIPVRKLYWNRTPPNYSKKYQVHTPVQSPVQPSVQSPARQQGNSAAPCTVRLLHREKELGVHLVSQQKELSDRDGRPPYFAEAHGVIIRASWQPCPHPIWVVQEKIQFEPPFPVNIVDLATNESMDSECASICWVPHREESDGTLLTVLNDVPGEFQIGSTKITKFNVVTQVPGCPGKTKAEWVEAQRISNCRMLSKKERETKFNAQLESLRSIQAASVFTQVSLRDRIRSPVDRLLTSPFRSNALPSQSATPDEDLEVPRPAALDRSIDESFVGSSGWSDDDNLSDDPFDESRPLSTVQGHCHLPLADEVEIIDLDSATNTPSIVTGSTSLAAVPEQQSSLTGSASQKHSSASDDDDSEDDFRSVCNWPLVPDLRTRLRSPDLSGLVDCSLDSSAFPLLDRTPAPEIQPTTPSADMMDVDAVWMPTNEEEMSLLQDGLPSTPPPSDGIHL